MFYDRQWKCEPQLKDLPRDSTIHITCGKCRRQWQESVRQMVDERRLGAAFMDLLEWQYPCRAKACSGQVAFRVISDEDARDFSQGLAKAA